MKLTQKMLNAMLTALSELLAGEGPQGRDIRDALQHAVDLVGGEGEFVSHSDCRPSAEAA